MAKSKKQKKPKRTSTPKRGAPASEQSTNRPGRAGKASGKNADKRAGKKASKPASKKATKGAGRKATSKAPSKKASKAAAGKAASAAPSKKASKTAPDATDPKASKPGEQKAPKRAKRPRPKLARAGDVEEPKVPTDALEGEGATTPKKARRAHLRAVEAAPEAEDPNGVEPSVAADGASTPPAGVMDAEGDDDIADTETFLRGLVEAILFVADRPLTLKEVARAIRVDKKRTEELLAAVMQNLRGRGIQIFEVAGGYSLRSNPVYADAVRAFVAHRPVRLSRAQLETLAIVAYRQPITRPEIDDVRGVDSGPVLKGLLERDLIKILGKKDEPGRPMLYGTTAAFLELFNMESLQNLPTLKEFAELTDESKELYERKLGEEAPDALPGLDGSDGEEGGGAPQETPDAPSEAEPTSADAAGAGADEDPAAKDAAPHVDDRDEPRDAAVTGDADDVDEPGAMDDNAFERGNSRDDDDADDDADDDDADDDDADDDDADDDDADDDDADDDADDDDADDDDADDDDADDDDD